MARLRWRDRWLLSLSARNLERAALLGWAARSLFDSEARRRGRLRCEWGGDSDCLSSKDAWRTMAGKELEQLIDRRMHLGRLLGRGNQWPELQATARALAATVREIQSAVPGTPVIISPFHYVSEYANIFVIDALRAELGLAELAVVSGSPREAYGNREDILIPGLRLLHTYDEENRPALGLKLVRALRQERIAVLFSDIPPYVMQRYPMETVEVSMFGKPARLHNGVFSIGKHLNGKLLCFHLTFHEGIFGHHIFAPVELSDSLAPQRVARYIEESYANAYPNWILADHPSRYGFAPSK